MTVGSVTKRIDGENEQYRSNPRADCIRGRVPKTKGRTQEDARILEQEKHEKERRENCFLAGVFIICLLLLLGPSQEHEENVKVLEQLKG